MPDIVEARCWADQVLKAMIVERLHRIAIFPDTVEKAVEAAKFSAAKYILVTLTGTADSEVIV